MEKLNQTVASQNANAEVNNDLERVEKFLRELPTRMEELNYCEDDVEIDNGNFAVLASCNEDGEIYVHLEISLQSEYKDDGEPIGDGWNWTVNDDDDLAECLNGISLFLKEGLEYLEKKNANYVIDYPLCRDWELQDNLDELCSEDIMEAWWGGVCWKGTYDIADTLGGVYSARIEYLTNATLMASILDPDDSEIWCEEFDLDYYDCTAFAFEDMCKWIDGKLDEISNK